MSLAIDLHRLRDYPTDEVVRWLKMRNWTVISMASGARMAAPPRDQRGIVDLMEAVLRQVIAEEEHERFNGMRFEVTEPMSTPPSPPKRASKPTRRERIKGAPEKDEDLFE